MHWKPRVGHNTDAALIQQLSQDLRLPALVSTLLVARGIASVEEASRFLSPAIEHLHSPWDMLGMAPAVERIEAALARGEKVLIYGDYDVDGTVAVVILKTAIELCGGAAEFHVPHRIREGYGMRDEVIERAAYGGTKLIISVDTGIRAFAAAETCQRTGLDLIVTDHHLPHSEGVPRAVAVLNPNQGGCTYPTKHLCGAGVAFKLAQALLERAGRGRLLPSFLKIVAIATIADAVPLTGENRVIARLGLAALRNPVNAGLRALMEVADLSGHNARRLTAGDVAFRLAPRLNAAGRMDVARDVVELFTLRDEKAARELADRLDKLNAERQAEEARIMAAIDERIRSAEAFRDAYCLVVDGDGWHKGVIGIAASRVVDRYHRPVLVLTREGDVAQGSGRTIDAFHLLNALEGCASLFTRFGGHAFAAGFALPVANIPQLRAYMEQTARAQLTTADLQPVLRYDIECDLNDITSELFSSVQRMAPFGMGNPEPVFVARSAMLKQPPRIIKDKHCKLQVSATADATNGNGMRFRRSFDAMGWRMAERAMAPPPLSAGDVLELAFTVSENMHPDYGGIELCLCDFRIATQATKATSAV